MENSAMILKEKLEGPPISTPADILLRMSSKWIAFSLFDKLGVVILTTDS